MVKAPATSHTAVGLPSKGAFAVITGHRPSAPSTVCIGSIGLGKGGIRNCMLARTRLVTKNALRFILASGPGKGVLGLG